MCTKVWREKPWKVHPAGYFWVTWGQGLLAHRAAKVNRKMILPVCMSPYIQNSGEFPGSPVLRARRSQEFHSWSGN